MWSENGPAPRLVVYEKYLRGWYTGFAVSVSNYMQIRYIGYFTYLMLILATGSGRGILRSRDRLP